MSGAELRTLLVQVVTSWQVIAVTIVIVFFIFLVNSAARVRKDVPPMSTAKPTKQSRKAAAAVTPEVSSDEEGLGLEEASAESVVES